MSLWDLPLVTSVAFHPRPHAKGAFLPSNATDGTFVSPTVSLGYRFYRPSPTYKAVVLLFHGNAEIAPDYASASSALASLTIPTALLVVDYRGIVFKVDVVGRSIGSQCAIHLASKFPTKFHGLILESGFHSILKLPMVNQLVAMLPGGAGMLSMLPELFYSLDKIQQVQSMPVLVLHGADDDIAPLVQGQELFAACGSSKKTLKVFPNAGHNDLVLRHHAAYYAAVNALLQDAAANAYSAVSGDAVKVLHALSAKQYDDVLAMGANALQSDRLKLEDQCKVLESQAKASWHLGDMQSVVKFTTRLLNRQPDHINGLCLRAKAYGQLHNVESVRDDVVALSQLLAGSTAEHPTKASVAMALLAVRSWTVQ
ncbi:hypothetical protein DYB30_000189 [Aphanomyces astaci]|uniref:Serine aminopeptidase S33 domain-containing protein n=2 Tax=Aphanomyces astaci TaxID=112090 RepID=A0A397DS35_APHAT|nr:hypothetical protein DYB30_000189 [Aphanomyces astaci]RHY67240.1 hypothetical protein DYB38_000032 [Aphanomyces astaci]RHZ16532.1 hypothetical protein DYB31_001527 [Aphanomyces astaci]